MIGLISLPFLDPSKWIKPAIDGLSILDGLMDAWGGKHLFELGAYIWDILMIMTGGMLAENPATGDYVDVWSAVSGMYTTFNAIAAALLTLFFLYGFIRDSCDLHIELTFDRTVKMFIRLIITVNLMGLALKWMPTFFSWVSKLVTEILVGKDMGKMFFLDGGKIYEEVAGSFDGGGFVAFGFLIAPLFFLLTVFAAFAVLSTVLKRMLKLYMIIPFAGIALSTLAAGGQTAQIGYSYIKTFFGYTCSALLMAVVVSVSGSFIGTITIPLDEGLVRLVEYSIKLFTIASAVKMADQVMQKAFGL